MGSSGGGGGGQSPTQAVPTGAPISSYGSSTPFDLSKFTSVLPDSATPMTTDMMSSAWGKNATAESNAAAQSAAASGGGSSGGSPGSMDAFAQKVLDARKNQQVMGYVAALDPRQMGNYAQSLQSMPKASTPTEQLMLQALQQRQQSGGSRMQSSR